MAHVLVLGGGLAGLSAAAAYAVRAWGFVSRKQAEESARPIEATRRAMFGGQQKQLIHFSRCRDQRSAAGIVSSCRSVFV